MPNPPDPKFQPSVMDDDLYRSLFTEKLAAAEAAAARNGKRITDKDINQCASDAEREARSAEFSIAATAWIRGDRTQANELCARVRAGSGDQAADHLMRRIEAAVEYKRAQIEASEEARLSKNRYRRR